MDVRIPKDWKKILEEEFEKNYFNVLMQKINEKYTHSIIYPAQTSIFHAFELCDFSTLKIVILGQDPYHADKQAHGLAFSVPEGIKIPPSLRNIYKEISNDIGATIPTSGNLERWAKQGVLLLNSTLTVEEGKPNSHHRLGWETFTDSVIKKISDEKKHVVFLLWGNFARSKKILIDTTKHLVLETPHPSPLSAHTGFLGCKHFSKTNTYLHDHHLPPINW